MIDRGKILSFASNSCMKMENTAARKLKQVPQGYLIVGIDPHKKNHAYFVEGKSIKGIAREYHHDRRIVRRAIRSSPAPVVSSEEKELVSV